MGSAWKKNMKNLQGKQDVTGHDVLHVGVANIATGTGGAITTADTFGIIIHTVTRNARLEGCVADVNPVLSSGELELDLLVNGVSVGSVVVTNAGAQILLDKENGNEVQLVAGDSIQLTYQVLVTLSAITDLGVRIHLALLEV